MNGSNSAIRSDGTLLDEVAVSESRLYRKIAWRLMPTLFLVYVASYLDRVNIGYAKLQFAADLGISDRAYGLGAGLFFVGYLLFEVPSNIYLARKGARRTISRIMILWGLVSSAMMFIRSDTSFYVLRFLLGAAEAGLVPGVMLYLTYWFPANRRARMIALFMLGIPVSGIIGAPLSGFIMQTFDGHHGLRGWQWMFLIEGIPSVLLGIRVYLRMDSHPTEASWLSSAERDLLATNLAGEQSRAHHAADAKSLLTSRRFWLLNAIYLCLVMGNAGFSFWLPQLVSDLGAKELLNVGMLSAIPYAVAGLGMVAVGHSSDRTGERRWHYAVGSFAGMLGLVVCCVYAQHMVVAIAGLSLSYLGILSCFGIFWSIATGWLRSEAAVIGLALINSISSFASYISPFVLGIARDMTHQMTYGLYFMAGCLAIGGVLVLRIPKSGS
ncbi:MFS transporter [Burkholderia cenocepacia]|uniref:MFS transporter n=1 Tax=Burkholderia cenocepacia TaxID=95486 RepID=UPI001B9E4565|nr:MFS transporter [Burkholderia cenocepacia]MBR8167999.1 MFS transporter [Burkholderia cenocepacia]